MSFRLILHGDNQIASRRELVNRVNEAKKNDQEIVTLDGRSLTLAELMQNLESQSLFNPGRTLIIESLFSNRSSAVKRSAVSTLAAQHPRSLSIILWEAKQLTPAQLKVFDNWRLEKYSAGPAVFKFLDALRPHAQTTFLPLFKSACSADSPEFVFFMLARRLRRLLLLNLPETRLSPWEKTRLLKQLRHFPGRSLETFYRRLAQLDWQLKSGKIATPLEQELTFILTNL